MTSEKEIIARLGDLPSLPTVAARINAEIESDAMSAKLLGAIISEDSSLTARILRLANSAFYGMPRQIASIERAVMVLGFDTVKNLALSLSIFSFFKAGKSPAIDVTGLWNHSLGVAVSARALIRRTNPKLAEQAFLLGILHDIGKVVLVSQALADLERVARLIQEGLSQGEAEVQVFGFTHQRLGALLAKEWKFPDCFASGVKLHHDLPPETNGLDEQTAQLTRALGVANQLAKALLLGVSTNPVRAPIPSLLWSYLGIGRESLPAMSAEIRDDYQKILRAWNME
ncbi:MAG: HDOD domain-containing protein [Desulfobacteraceae bacterium]|nr:HDOD domain-containing protein [Desulfobacteraceae bacterium]